MFKYALLLIVALSFILSSCGTSGPNKNANLETAALNDEPIWRAQIRLVTANISDAGSDDSVKVALSSANSTWLDYGRDDFERNTSYLYDLNLSGLKTFRDVSQIKIEKIGTDGWCLKSFELLLNDRLVYSQSFSTCRWLDGNDSHFPSYTVISSTLRNSTKWKSYTRPPLSSIAVLERTELESRIEGMVGHYIHGNDLYWGHLYGRAVEITKASISNAIHVDLDLSVDISWVPDPEVDVDFDVVFSCTSGVVNISVKNLKKWVGYDVPILGTLVNPIVNYLATLFGPALKAVFSAIQVNTGSTTCPTFFINSNADVVMLP